MYREYSCKGGRIMQIVLAYDKLDDIRHLFQEYTAMLVETDETVKACLAAQGYGDELDHAEEKYGLPDGRLVGCAAIHRLDETCCELKRLYIQPACRGRGLSRLLMEQCIGEAKQIGYRQMRLDTLPFMTAAIGLYRQYGFYEIPPYYDNPIPAIFMQKDL